MKSLNLIIMASKMEEIELTKDQMNEFKQAFELFDLDKNGKISHKELKKIMHGLGQNPTEVEIEALKKEIRAVAALIKLPDDFI